MRRLLAVAAVLAVALSGCASQSAASDPATSGATADYAFTTVALDGAEFEGESLAGTPAVLWFWAPWCPTCRAQSGNVSELAERYRGEVAVVGVGGFDSEQAITSVAESIPHVTHLLDPSGEVWQHFGVTAQSTYTVIDGDGEIVHEGYLDDGRLNVLVAELAE